MKMQGIDCNLRLLTLIMATSVYNVSIFTIYSKTRIHKGIEMDKNWINVLIVCALLAVLIFAGCAEPVSYPEIVGEVPSFVIPSRYRILGTSVQRRPIMCLQMGQGPDVTYIMATIHGNEAAGTPLVRRLARYLRQNRELLSGRMVVLMSVANPDGMVNRTRHNAKGVDLNRNFEAANRVNSKETGLTSLSEPETRIIKQLILQYKPDRIVTIHQPLACIDYDGPGRMLAARMAQYCDLPVKKLGARPGSLGSYAGETLGIPIITFEMLPTDSQLDSQALWQKYGRALLAAVVYPDPLQ
jgi:protein MpaA